MNPSSPHFLLFQRREKSLLLNIKASNYVLDPIYKQIRLPALSVTSLSVTCSLFLSINCFLSAHKNASSVLHPPSFITYLLSNYKYKVSNALKSHDQITRNPCLQGGFHLVRGQLSQQLQGNC